MFYQKTINGRHAFAGAVEIYVESAEEDGYVSGGHAGFFHWDKPIASSDAMFALDSEGQPKLFEDPMDAIGAAFLLAEEIARAQ